MRTRISVDKHCKSCGKTLTPIMFRYYYLYKKAKFCSMLCSNNYVIATRPLCLVCGKTCPKKTSKYCSMECHSKDKKASAKYKYIVSGGYVLIKIPGHPYSFKTGKNKGRIYEHRYVMEQHLGRYLHPKEVVHHINEIRNDNRLCNLKLFSGVGEHSRYHHKGLLE